MASCIDGFIKEMGSLQERFASARSSIRELINLYHNLSVHTADLLLSGLAFSGCAIYKHPVTTGAFIGVCQDKAVEYSGTYFESAYETKGFHKLLRELIYAKAPQMKSYMMNEIVEESYEIYLDEMEGYINGRMIIYYPRSGVEALARRYGIPPPAIYTDRTFVFGRYGAFEIILSPCSIEKTMKAGFKPSVKCPSNYTPLEGFCKVLDAVLDVFKGSIDFYFDILFKGIKFLNLYLLY
jgi:hypothetical protein